MDNWDEYFINICDAVAKNSKCLSRQIGAVIVSDKSIISTGFNGPPRGITHCGRLRYEFDSYLKQTFGDRFEEFTDDQLETTCPRKLLGYKSGGGLHICTASHAERNAIVNAARVGIKINGAKMYMNCPMPCSECLKEIINAGIEEIVISDGEYYDDLSRFLIRESYSLKVRTYNENKKL